MLRFGKPSQLRLLLTQRCSFDPKIGQCYSNNNYRHKLEDELKEKNSNNNYRHKLEEELKDLKEKNKTINLRLKIKFEKIKDDISTEPYWSIILSIPIIMMCIAALNNHSLSWFIVAMAYTWFVFL